MTPEPIIRRLQTILHFSPTIALAAALFSSQTPAGAHERLSTVVAHGDGIALASICTNGGYILMLTATHQAHPWPLDCCSACVLDADQRSRALMRSDSEGTNAAAE